MKSGKKKKTKKKAKEEEPPPLPPSRAPTPPQIPKASLYGKSLVWEREDTGNMPPEFVRACIDRVMQPESVTEAHRLPSGVLGPCDEHELRALEIFLSNPDVSAHAMAFSVPCVLEFLRRYLAQLPEPLLTFDKFYQFSRSMGLLHSVWSDTENNDFFDKLLFVKSLVVTLPMPHYLLLKSLVAMWVHIVAVSREEAQTRPWTLVDASKLAFLFAPETICKRPRVIMAERKRKRDELAEGVPDPGPGPSPGPGPDPASPGPGAAPDRAPDLAPDPVPASPVAIEVPATYTQSELVSRTEVVKFLIQNYEEIFGVNCNHARLLHEHLSQTKQLFNTSANKDSKIRSFQGKLECFKENVARMWKRKQLLRLTFGAWKRFHFYHGKLHARLTEKLDEITDELMRERKRRRELETEVAHNKEHIELCQFDKRLHQMESKGYMPSNSTPTKTSTKTLFDKDLQDIYAMQQRDRRLARGRY